MDRPWEAFDRARRVLRGRDDLAGGKSAGLPSVSADVGPKPAFISGEVPREIREETRGCCGETRKGTNETGGAREVRGNMEVQPHLLILPSRSRSASLLLSSLERLY